MLLQFSVNLDISNDTLIVFFSVKVYFDTFWRDHCGPCLTDTSVKIHIIQLQNSRCILCVRNTDTYMYNKCQWESRPADRVHRDAWFRVELDSASSGWRAGYRIIQVHFVNVIGEDVVKSSLGQSAITRGKCQIRWDIYIYICFWHGWTRRNLLTTLYILFLQLLLKPIISSTVWLNPKSTCCSSYLNNLT